MINAYDVIVVGAGHNGLVAACYLAKAGLSSCVLEKCDVIGGLSRSEAVFGERLSVYSLTAAWSGMFQADIAAELGLDFDFAALDPQLLYRTTTGGVYGDFLEADETRDFHDRLATGSGDSERLIRSLERYKNDVGRASKALRVIFGKLTLKDRARTYATIPQHVHEFWLSPLKDLLEGYRGLSDVARVALAQGAMSVQNGPLSNIGGGFYLAYMSLGETANIPGAWGLPRGGMGTISGRLAARYRYLGGELHTRAEVVRVEPQEDGGFAVLLQDGEYLKARAVVISTSLDQLGILTGGEITVESETIGGTSATLHIELNDVPAVHSDLKPWLSERLSRGQPVLLGSGPESLEKLDYSIDRVGEEPDGFSRPLLLSSSFFWDGPRPVLFVYSQFVGNSCVKARLVEECVGQLTECFFPDLASRINSVVALTPADIETRLGSPLGHPEHNQMFFPDLIWCRPSRTLAEYRTRWRGLYHGSASSYPGGLVTGIPGRNVAKVLLRDFESA